MRRRPPRPTRTDTLFPDTTLFRSWSISKRGVQFGYIATPVDPAGKRDRIPTADFTSIAAHHFTEAARDWLTGTRGFTAKLVPEYAPYAEDRKSTRLNSSH